MPPPALPWALYPGPWALQKAQFAAPIAPYNPRMNPLLTPFFHAPTYTWTWVVEDPSSQATAIVDPALDYDPKSGRIDTWLADAVIAHVHDRRREVQWILETHAHADHLTAAQYLKQQLGGKVAIGAGIVTVQRHFAGVLNLAADFAADGAPFDHRFVDGERFRIGALEAEVIATPGHTPDSLTYRVGDALFIGDTLFAPDVGSARCDFPGGDAGMLWDSIQRLLALPDATRVCLAHDYPPGGREPRAIVPLRELRERNVHVAGQDREGYIAMRSARDATLAAPQLLWPALQVNIRAGQLPPAEANGAVFLKVPVSGGW
jgi:glyoxylase-like metal-dependent hydrolase (beta-lactamase superfamily II)